MEKKEYEFGQARRHVRLGPGGPGGRMGGGEKPKDLIGTWKKLLVYCKKYVAVFIAAICCAALGTVLQLLGPDKLSQIAGYIEAGLLTGIIDLDAIVKVCITLVFFYAASWVLSAAQQWMMATFTQRVSKTMRGDISRKINRLPIW